ncbi:hypothetical protein FQN57_007156 [Myotisia sp. PD_48]|nr:hypothetical protein FQN57_007156 [Myotisia sp. PD_48]
MDTLQKEYKPYSDDDSCTVQSGDTIYTPSYSTSTSGDTESVVLLEDQENSRETEGLLSKSGIQFPPGYHDEFPVPAYSAGDAKVDMPTSGLQLGGAEQDTEQPCRTKRRGCCGRMRRGRGCGENEKRAQGQTCCQKFIRGLKMFGIIWLTLWVFMWSTSLIKRKFHGNSYGGCGGWKPHSNAERQIIIKEHGKSVDGHFPLFDLLAIKTSSGSISVVVHPQPADPKNPYEPARLRLKSSSGTISVEFAMPSGDDDGKSNGKGTYLDSEEAIVSKSSPRGHHDDRHASHPYPPHNPAMWPSSPSTLPPRPYEIEIQTKSGSINAKVGFTTRAKFSSTSGSINTVLTPFIFSDPAIYQPRGCHGSTCSNVDIQTSIRSGNLFLKLVEPMFFNESSTLNIDSKQADRYSHSRFGWSSKMSPPRKGDDDRSFELKATASHKDRGSGPVSFVYPHSWAGVVRAGNWGSGPVSLKGYGLDVDAGRHRGEVFGKKKATTKPGEKGYWWGSSGDMEVEIRGGGSGPISFQV